MIDCFIEQNIILEIKKRANYIKYWKLMLLQVNKKKKNLKWPVCLKKKKRMILIELVKK